MNFFSVFAGSSPIDFKYGIRIREKNKQAEFTIKINLDEGKLEINQQLTKEEYDAFKSDESLPEGEVFDEIRNRSICNPNDLKVFATLFNTRMDTPYQNSLISIDKCEYLGFIDYEIECESTSMDEATKTLKSFLKKENIPFVRNTITKLKRVKSKLI